MFSAAGPILTHSPQIKPARLSATIGQPRRNDNEAELKIASDVDSSIPLVRRVPSSGRRASSSTTVTSATVTGVNLFPSRANTADKQHDESKNRQSRPTTTDTDILQEFLTTATIHRGNQYQHTPAEQYQSLHQPSQYQYAQSGSQPNSGRKQRKQWEKPQHTQAIQGKMPARERGRKQWDD